MQQFKKIDLEKMKRNLFFVMLNAPGVCSARVYTDILIGQAVT
jgi:hypothetical protein